MDNYMSGASSPASSSLHGDSFMGSSSDVLHRPLNGLEWGPTCSSSWAIMLSSSRSSSGVFIQNLELQVQRGYQVCTSLSDRCPHRVTAVGICRAAYQELVNAVPALLTVTSNPFNLLVPSSENLDHLGTTTTPLPRTTIQTCGIGNDQIFSDRVTAYPTMGVHSPVVECWPRKELM